MAHQELKPEYTFTEEKIKALKQIVPEAFEDGKINFETLRECLGDLVEDGDEERFGLNWPGKRDARRLAAIPSEGTLVPVYGDGLKADGTPDDDGENDSRNIFIEGENLEVLKILHKSYAGRIKMIYIDPPYNTGNDFVYDDDFTEPLQHYLRRTGQIDDEGRALTTNKRADGRFHSKWLSMMYPRLKLARELLREDGVIFVSIDDNEVHNLRELMNEVFGEENFLAQLIIQSNKRGQTFKQISKTHEYLLVFTMSPDTEINELEKEVSDLNLEDNIGPFNIRELRNRNPKFGRHNRPNLFYPIYVDEDEKDENGLQRISLDKDEMFNIEVLPYNSEGVESCWRWGRELLKKNLAESSMDSNAVARRKKDGRFNIYEKYRKNTYKVKSIWTDTSVITEQGTLDLKKIGLSGMFDFPKPVALIRKCIELGTSDEDIILDFFAGSSTLAQATLEYNQDKKSGRKFIVVQVPSPTPTDSKAFKAGYSNLAGISSLRIKSTIKAKDLQAGYKFFRLQSSQLHQEWTGDIGELFQAERNWHKEELLYELILTEGFPLDSEVTPEKDYTANSIRSVRSDFHGHYLLVCLDEKIEEATIQQLDLSGDAIFVCFDHAITDQDKLRLSDKGLIKTIG